MKLHSLDGEFFMPQSHDGAASVFFRSPCADFEFCWQILLLHDKRVVTSARHGCGQAAKDALVIVGDGAGLAVHQVRSPHDAPAKGRSYSLMSQANPENRHFAGKVPDQINAD